MELSFIGPQTVYSGANPDMIHMEDNSIYGFKIEDGRLVGDNVEQPIGEVDWLSVAMSDFVVSTKDKNISLMRLKNILRVGIYGVWHQDAVLEGAEVITPERHRLAIWQIIQLTESTKQTNM